MQKLIVILGPTASGKTSLSLELAKKYKGYIISADSRQIYKGMDIGTAKASKEEQKTVPHHLINIVNPDQNYNLSHFKKDTLKIIKEKKGLPFLVGGTGLYIDSIIHNITPPKVPPDDQFRKEIEKRIKKEGLDKIYNELIITDPEAKEIVDPKNPRRVIRALEVTKKSGKPFSAFYKKGPKLFDYLLIGIMPEREKLYQKIDDRVDQMIADGLIEETKKLFNEYGKDIPSMSSLGYKQIIPYLEGKIKKDEAIEEVKKETRKYAKRQITWLKRYENAHWIHDSKEASKKMQEFLKKK